MHLEFNIVLRIRQKVMTFDWKTASGGFSTFCSRKWAKIIDFLIST